MRAFGRRLELGIELTAREPLRGGDAVAGTVHVAAGGDVRALSVRLAYVERSPDYVATAFVAEERVLASGAVADGAALPFSLRLPADALPSMAAAPHATVRWELRAWADVLGPDPDDVRALDVVAGADGGAPPGRFDRAPEAPGGP